MSDFSAAVPWLTTGVCCLISLGLGKYHGRADAHGSILLAALKAFALGIASIFIAAVFHEACIRGLQLCQSHGDANIGFVVLSFAGAPVYALLIVLADRYWHRPAGLRADPHEAASARALLEHHQGARPSTRCPSCGELITVLQEQANGRRTHLLTRCRCSRSNARVRLKSADS